MRYTGEFQGSMVRTMLVGLFVLVLQLSLFQDVRGQKNFGSLAGYKFESDVEPHSLLDLDQKTMEELTDAFKWSEANSIYAGGKNSKKSNSLRTLKGFSSDADPKLAGEGYWELYKEYNDGNGDYADKFVTNALNGVKEFAGKENIFRAECANKGSQYQNVWMYVIHEMEDAINDCNNNDLNDNDKGVKAWDEAWAFYAGSLEGEEGTKEGFMLYALAEKRCLNFGLCPGGKKAPVNSKILSLMNKGRTNLNNGDCDGALNVKNDVVKQMTVPVVQGALRYVESTKAKVDAKSDAKSYAKEHAEGLAFVRAFLPILHHCDSKAADLVYSNFKPDANPPMKDGLDKVSKAIFGQLGCMGISCADVGVLEGGALPECSTSSKFKAVKGTDVSAAENAKNGVFGSGGKKPSSGSGSSGSGSSGSSSSSSSGGLSGGAIAGIVIGALVALAIVAAVAVTRMRKKKKASTFVPAADQEGDQTFA